ncbi:MAG TPA: hypothetical protein VMU52_00985 [Steroidobacteraceae bacterium]|nr:hypothetical protein [Steroidobacteraceae bacterium]
MLHLYVLYACVHFAGKHVPQAGKTQCVESQVFFNAGQCRRQLPKRPDKAQKTDYGRSWLECDATTADSWIPAAEANESGNRMYKAIAAVSDAGALAALLAPLAPQERAALAPGDFKGRLERSFQGPGRLSFFIIGTGSRVLAVAVTNLDDFQFADFATDVSSSAAAMTGDEDLDFSTIAEDAGIQLSYHTEMSRRDKPPPGGMRAEP